MSDTEVLRLDAVDLVRESRQILTDVNMTVHAGGHWALIGPNGAGKSTILSMCGAVNHPTRGSVHVLGHRLGRVDIRELRRSIGHVNPRHPLRSPLTVQQIILTGATGTTELVPRWAPDDETLARTEQLIDMLGLGDVKGATWPTMSQGERGRALIARSLLPDPRSSCWMSPRQDWTSRHANSSSRHWMDYTARSLCWRPSW